MLLPGLKVSTLASTVQGRSLTMRLSFTMGVLPMVLRMFSWIFMDGKGIGMSRRVDDPRTYANRIALAGAMRVTSMLGTTSAATHTSRVPMFNSTSGHHCRSMATTST